MNTIEVMTKNIMSIDSNQVTEIQGNTTVKIQRIHMTRLIMMIITPISMDQDIGGVVKEILNLFEISLPNLISNIWQFF